MNKKILLLDCGGVLIEDPMQRLFSRLALLSRKTKEEIEKFYQTNLRKDLWEGNIPENFFWGALFGFCNLKEDPSEWRTWFASLQVPLLESSYLREFSSHSAVWLLSNHRSEWLLPLLEKYNFSCYFTELLISDREKFAKPDPSWFEAVRKKIGSREVLYVDDQQSNLDVAAKHNIPGCLADKNNLWVKTVNIWLGIPESELLAL